MARRHRPVVQVVATGRRHRELVAVDRDYFLDLLPGTVTVEGMPARYKVVDDYDEEPAVTAYELLGPLAIDAPAPVTDVPLDLAGGSLDRTPLPELPSIGYPSHARDLAVRAGDLCEVGANIGPLEIRDQSGSAGGFIDLVMANRFSVEVPPSVPDVIADLRSPDTAHAALVVLDARSRLTGCAMADGVEIIVIECSPTKAGMALPDGVAAFELGTRHALPNDEQVSIWNDGPGPLVLLLRHLVDLPQAVPRWRAALGSLRRRLVRDG